MGKIPKKGKKTAPNGCLPFLWHAFAYFRRVTKVGAHTHLCVFEQAKAKDRNQSYLAKGEIIADRQINPITCAHAAQALTFAVRRK